MKPKIANVSQGRADVLIDGKPIGFVEFNQSARMWWGYTADGKRIGNWPNCKRDHAVRDVAEHWRSL